MFQGFPPTGIVFLNNLKNNNTKEWFETHRDEYEQTLRLPSKALIEEMAVLFDEHAMPFEATLKRSLFRINRDIRFSKDKSPYKTNIGITFPLFRSSSANSSSKDRPGMYVHIEPHACFIAGGLYMPDAKQLRSIRERIDHEWMTLHTIIHDEEFLHAFPKGLQGAKLKTMPRGFFNDHPGKDLLRLQQMYVMSELSQDLILNEQFTHILLAKANIMEPFLVFLEEALVKG